MIASVQEDIRTYENRSTHNLEAEESNFCTRIDTETAILLNDIRSKYTKETNASILAKAIRNLHDMTCRTFARTA